VQLLQLVMALVVVEISRISEVDQPHLIS